MGIPCIETVDQLLNGLRDLKEEDEKQIARLDKELISTRNQISEIWQLVNEEAYYS